MAAKKSSNSKTPTPAQIAALKKTPVGKVKPDTAITNKGQKATGLAKPSSKDRISPEFSKNIPTSQKAVNALNWAGKTSAETIALAGAGKLVVNPLTKVAAKSLGKFVGGRTAQSAYNANMKGLFNATGMGGKVSRTQTPMGPMLRSTTIGTAKQQAARINNLETAAFKKATRAGAEAQSKTIIDVLKAGKQVKKSVPVVGGLTSANKNKPKKK